jgi:hypothetical protein
MGQLRDECAQARYAHAHEYDFPVFDFSGGSDD